MAKTLKVKHKRASISTLTLDKIDFNSKAAARDKEGHYIMIKRSIHQPAITIVNIYRLNINAPKYIKQIIKPLNGEIDNILITVWDLNTYFQQ